MPPNARFRDLLVRSQNPAGLALVGVLSWIAHADGEISEAEEAALFDIAKSCPEISKRSELMAIVRTVDTADIEAACIMLRGLPQPEQRVLLLQLAIGVAVADRYLTLAENHILRFLSDLLGLEPSAFESLFEQVTGRSFPDVGDPSSVEWWELRERVHRAPERGEEAPNRDYRRTERVRALALLGLEEGAGEEEIRGAYRRLARVHHPDRFQPLGDEAVKMASVTFRRIREAYEVLGAP